MWFVLYSEYSDWTYYIQLGSAFAWNPWFLGVVWWDSSGLSWKLPSRGIGTRTFSGSPVGGSPMLFPLSLHKCWYFCISGEEVSQLFTDQLRDYFGGTISEWHAVGSSEKGSLCLSQRLHSFSGFGSTGLLKSIPGHFAWKWRCFLGSRDRCFPRPLFFLIFPHLPCVLAVDVEMVQDQIRAMYLGLQLCWECCLER